MFELFAAFVIGLMIVASTSGCASKQYIMKECKKVVDQSNAETGEQVCKRANFWE